MLKTAKISTYLLLGTCLTVLGQGVRAQSSLPAFGPTAPPSTEVEPQPSQRDQIPPAGYSPPKYDEQNSQQFLLYRLGVGDAVTVTVPDFPEFSSATAVDAEGNMLIPILGRIPVKGLTLDELETKISYELGQKYLKEQPEVIAVIATPRPVRLIVLGEILRPGYYNVAPNTLLTDILTTAGGSTGKADLRSVIVRRTLVDGTVLEEAVDLYTPLIKGTKVPEFRLQEGDSVVVSRLEVGKDTGYDRSLIARTTLIQPTITVRLLSPLIPSGRVLRNVELPNGSDFLDVIATLPTTDVLRIKRDEVALLRFDPEKGGVVTQKLNPEAALRGDIAQNVLLEDQDVIIVSRTILGEFFAFFNIITQPIRDIQTFSTSITNFQDTFDRNR
jgi:polysaccharide export outer membrane protein